MFMWAMSDRGIPRSYRMMQGFGVNTFTLTNAEGVRSFVKFHFTPALYVDIFLKDFHSFYFLGKREKILVCDLP